MKIAIVGAGKLGLKVTEALLGGDHSVTIIDQDESVLQKLSSHLDVMTVNANAKETKILKNLGISTYDYLIAVTESDETNIVIAAFAKKLGCAKVISRVRDPEHMGQLGFIKETMDIDSIVNPDLSITVEIYKYLVEKYTLSNGIFSSGKVSLLEFNSEKLPQLIGLSMPEVSSVLGDMLVAAISRNGKVIIPHGDTVIHPEDGLYVIGERTPVMELNAQVHEKGKYTDLQKVMIVGGGKTGYYLAGKLSEFGVAVKIIEMDKNRCHYLSTHLEDVMVLHGDATDLDLLEEENLDEMDAFVTATGYDEENLLLALMAKRHGIEDVIAKVSRESYSDLIESMGIDMALNPLDITASTILRFVQGSKRVISSVLIQGQAEIMEIVASDHMRLVDTPLRELNLPRGVIVAAIHRGLNVIIPDGETIIEEDDRVIIFSLLTELPNLEKLLKVSGKFSFFRK
ncbi:Trk system potassium transporter TrkA [Ihubacter massiliensis]|uniref:Trk system potassium uptake protein TrkA n=1 Tax=Hominibacterium faecale TaxID=2839743 RepID=A0A9J6QY00_9FIRM|nr:MULTISPECIES: Trk system potassium transporter TrkA [Eubacteriales Family XIII. Incertae Sedis]MCI7302350.1 Trk system potassium transporter TrkA [Clostridia bacterium]MDE8733908.1 Trk system potassium transporter TrkA [Eubacteriales bacterium DFI.9.88]MDY3011017.1 Trk system potassium transporter TrkA [Clostridiales Family XIII bacterium]MCO7123707.1 Trk system potassium transporter TrkA [Ihubacter massiliensis]MCU7380361.1 Trk system potassium transporter TrkA [Hominibacterium faecale]